MYGKMKKKGLSDVITTVLIILLVLASVVLIWGFIRAQLRSGGTTVEASTSCLNLELQPLSCNVARNTAGIAGNVTATVKWKSGDVDLDNIKFIVADKNGVTNTTASTGTLSMYSAVSSVISVLSLTESNEYTLSAVGVIKLKDGNLFTCAELSESIVCA